MKILLMIIFGFLLVGCELESEYLSAESAFDDLVQSCTRSSHRESIPRRVAEAAASRVPLVVAPRGATDDEPLSRLHEFAWGANYGTVYYHEVVITSVHRGLPNPYIVPRVPTFEVGFGSLEHLENMELRSEILEFTGIEEDDIWFRFIPVNSSYAEFEFVRVNAELAELYEKWTRLNEFSEILRLTSVRRGIGMGNLAGAMGPPTRGAAPFRFTDGTYSQRYMFQVGLCREFYGDEEIIALLLEFTGISPDEIVFWDNTYSERVRGNSIARAELDAEQTAQLLALEAHRDTVNAPFWQDKFQHDPVITGISWWVAFRIDGGESTLQFTISLYDETFLDLPWEELYEATADIRREITAATGVENIMVQSAMVW
jgi:hypothetical protein